MAYITFEQIKNDSTVATYIRQADIALKAYGYTEHSFPHVTRAAKIAAKILGDFGYPQRRKSPDFCMISGTASIGWTMPKAAP